MSVGCGSKFAALRHEQMDVSTEMVRSVNLRTAAVCFWSKRVMQSILNIRVDVVFACIDGTAVKRFFLFMQIGWTVQI